MSEINSGMSMPWWILAFLSSITVCFDIGLNRFFKKEPAPLLFWISIIQVIIFLPCLFLVQLPTSLICPALLSGIALGFMDIRILTAAKTISGAVIAQIMAMRIWLVFFIWSIIDYQNTVIFLDDPRFYGVLAALVFGSVSLYFMRKCSMSYKALIILLPAVLASALSTLTLKTGLSVTGETGPYVPLAYACIAVCAQGLFCLGWLVFHRKLASAWDVSFCVPALILGFTMSVTMGLRFVAFVDAPNPSYIYMIAVLSSVWLYLFGKIRGLDAGLNPWAGFSLVLSAVLLIYLTA